MLRFFDTYQYLTTALLHIPAIALAAWLAPRQRKMMLLSAVLLACFSPLSVLHDGTYWSPTRLLGGHWGIEDVIFCMSVGSLLWVMAVWPLRHETTFTFNPARLARELLPAALGAVGAVFMANRLLGNAMLATIVVQAGLMVALMFWFRDHRSIAVRGSLAFLAYYSALIALFGRMFTDFHAMWNGPEILGPRVLNYPVEEYLWAATLGFLPLGLFHAGSVRRTSQVTAKEAGNAGSE